MWSPTGMTCDVHSFTPQQPAQKNIPVGTCVTVYTTPAGQDVCLFLHEVLFFGPLLPNSLINPNQLRHHGALVQDDYTRDEPFGITTSELFIPLQTRGTNISFTSRTPTPTDLETLPHVTLTSPDPWDPHSVSLQPVRIAGACSNRTDSELQYELTVDEAPIDPLTAISSGFSPNWQLSATTSSERHTTVSPESLSRLWRVGLDTAKRTLRVTTQKGVRTALHPIQRRYRVDHIALHRNRLDTTFYVDGLVSRVTSLRGNNHAYVYTNGSFTAVYPVATKDQAGSTLGELCTDVGTPENLVADLAGELSGKHTEFMKHVRQNRIQIRWAEKGRHNQNHKAEREIGILKARWRRRMVDRQVPRRLWDYGLVYEAELLSRTVRSGSDRTGYEQLTGNTPDISEWADFAFYDLVWTHTEPHPGLTDESRRLGRWLGISHRVGSDLCYWVLLESGQVISGSTVQHVTSEELQQDEIKTRVQDFNRQVNERLDDANFTSNDLPGLSPYIQDIPSEVEDNARKGITPSDEEYGGMIVEETHDADDEDDYDKYIGAQIRMDIGGEPLQATVVKRSKGDLDGKPVGKAHQNPMFDSRLYDVEFQDGTVERYTANIIAENIFSQIDSEGRSYSLLDEIIDHRKDHTAIPQSEGFTIGHNGNRVPKKTTRGWELLIQWKGEEASWVKLRDLKDSNPIELAEYAQANQLADEPAFHWWVCEILRRKKRMIAKVTKKYWRTDHKYGIELPHSVEEALAIDRKTNTDFWAKAIAKEQGRVRVAWEAKYDMTPEDCRAGRALIGFTEIKCHMIFDVKMDFTRKARFVAGGHLTDAPAGITYSSVVSRDSVRLAFLIAALNDLDIMACDIGNAYLNAPCREKVWFLGGAEVGEDRGKVLVITRALYGLKSSGASWRLTLANTLKGMGFVDTRADADVYRRPATDGKGREYYELLLVYVDDILLVSHDPKPTIDQVGKEYRIKEGSAGAPETYLGAQVYRHHLPDGRAAWGMSCEKYVRNAVATVERLLTEDGERMHLKTTALVPFPTTYKPEVDLSDELSPALQSRYRQLIGILRWAVELGRLDIYMETSLLSHYLASPREGHLEAAYHIFAYLKKHRKSAIVFDPKGVTLDYRTFANVPVAAWNEFYGKLAEEIPPNMPPPRGHAVDITCFVDANHAGNVVTRRSHTGIIIFVQNAPIVWLSKRQNTVESSSFGSEFVALRAAKDLIVALRYKLRMFGVPVVGPASVLCDNQGVVKNTSLPESTLTKRHNAINYHSVREAVAAGIIRVGKEDGNSNLADCFTKVLGRLKRYQLFSKILYSSMYGKEGPPRKRQRLVSSATTTLS